MTKKELLEFIADWYSEGKWNKHSFAAHLCRLCFVIKFYVSQKDFDKMKKKAIVENFIVVTDDRMVFDWEEDHIEIEVDKFGLEAERQKKWQEATSYFKKIFAEVEKENQELFDENGHLKQDA
jgi:hypothetical protein